MTDTAEADDGRPELPEGLYAARRRGRDLRALAGRGRLRARRRRLDGRPGAAAVHDHPAAAQRHGLAPPRPRPADRGRGPDDPPRPDARPPRRCSCRASTTPASPPSSSSTGSSPRKARAASRSAASATSSGCARSPNRPGRSCSASSGGSARRPTGAGCATRWTRARRKAVRVAFERLYRDGLAYRTEALVNWCPGCRTSVSDLEVIPTPETGTLWTVRYHLIDEATGEPDPDATITVATTRPETILGDTAVAVHPDDARYAPSSGAGRGSRSSSATCRSSPTTSSSGRSAPAR